MGDKARDARLLARLGLAALLAACSASEADADGVVIPGPDVALDAGSQDAGALDAAPRDASASDASLTDTSPSDAGSSSDTGSSDAGPADAGSSDAGSSDASAVDASSPDGSPDPCVSVANACNGFGATCDGDVLEICTLDDDGCYVLSTLDCARSGGMCDSDLLQCVGGEDPCIERDECHVPGSVCDARGDIEDCAPDVFGCLVETRVPCESEGLGECSDGGFGFAFCEDPCDLVEECPAEVYCDGDVVRCAPDAEGCLVEASRERCEEGTLCDPGTLTCEDPCAGLPLCEGERLGGCVEDVATSCIPDANGCLVERVTDCTTLGVACVESPLGGECEGVGACEVEQRLSCGETVLGDTAAGGTLFESVCGFSSYPGAERVYAFTHEETAFVTVTLRGEGPVDLDLFALDGADGCGVDAACLASSRGSGPRESLSFASPAGRTRYLVVDAFLDAGLTAPYALDVACTIPDCGNGALEDGEACDDGARDDGDGCSAGCAVEQGFVCDDAEPSVCRPIVCGDGRVEGGEGCDDGGREPGDGCAGDCKVEPGYLCEGAPSVCERVCGNGRTDAGEACDDGNELSGDGCSAVCAVEEGYTCREVGSSRPWLCRAAVCGNGLLDAEEACDDANGEADDGCAACDLEAGYVAVGAAAVPAECVSDDALTYEARCGSEGSASVECAGPCAFTVPEAGALELTGALEAGDVRWHRIAGCDASDGAEDHYVDLYVIENVDARAYTLDVVAEWSADGYLHVFDTAVDVRFPADGCIAHDDDEGSTRASRLSVDVPAGRGVVIAASTYFAEETASYTLTLLRRAD